MQDRDDLQRLGVGTIDDQIGVNREKSHCFASEVFPPMSSAGIFRKENDPVPNDSLDALCHFQAALFVE